MFSAEIVTVKPSPVSCREVSKIIWFLENDVDLAFLYVLFDGGGVNESNSSDQGIRQTELDKAVEVVWIDEEVFQWPWWYGNYFVRKIAGIPDPEHIDEEAVEREDSGIHIDRLVHADLLFLPLVEREGNVWGLTAAGL